MSILSVATPKRLFTSTKFLLGVSTLVEECSCGPTNKYRVLDRAIPVLYRSIFIL
jgi:hypothetical protein